MSAAAIAASIIAILSALTQFASRFAISEADKPSEKTSSMIDDPPLLLSLPQPANNILVNAVSYDISEKLRKGK